ncbi:hypothetical protein [Aquisphaera insulae]|uniref:hypothetical protein n=1 Tax=Aquisphaera insulae TaxID=2712864 RepID=UPI0013EA4343|nr:hypothetical protein [Aquisphaera insulae]
MSESEALLAELEEIRLEGIELFRQMSGLSARLHEIARESPTDPEFVARAGEVRALQQEQRALGLRQQRAFGRKKEIERRLRELEVPGPWDENPASGPDASEAT